MCVEGYCTVYRWVMVRVGFVGDAFKGDGIVVVAWVGECCVVGLDGGMDFGATHGPYSFSENLREFAGVGVVV